MNIAEKITTLRKQKGLSQEALAEHLNLSRQAVSRWEMGTALPDATNILQLSKLFDVSTDYLLNDDYNSDQDIPAVKNQKEFLLLILLQAIAFVFHLICCLYLAKLFSLFPIVSLVINVIMIRKLKGEFSNQHNISTKIIKLYHIIYVSVICLLFLVPVIIEILSYFMLYNLFGF